MKVVADVWVLPHFLQFHLQTKCMETFFFISLLIKTENSCQTAPQTFHITDHVTYRNCTKQRWRQLFEKSSQSYYPKWHITSVLWTHLLVMLASVQQHYKNTLWNDILSYKKNKTDNSHFFPCFYVSSRSVINIQNMEVNFIQ